MPQDLNSKNSAQSADSTGAKLLNELAAQLGHGRDRITRAYLGALRSAALLPRRANGYMPTHKGS